MTDITIPPVKEFLNNISESLIHPEMREEFGLWKECLINEVPNNPFFYQIVAMTCKEHEIVSTYKTRRFQVSSKKMKKLTSLDSLSILENIDFDVDFENYSDLKKLPSPPLDDSGFNRNDPDFQLAIKHPESLSALLEDTHELFQVGISAISGIIDPYSLAGVEAVYGGINDFLKVFDSRTDPQMRSARATLRFIRKLTAETDPSGIIQKTYDLQVERGLRDFLGLKIERVKELRGVDENLAIAYLKYTPMTKNALDLLCERELTFKDFPIQFNKLPIFIKGDEKLYQEILSRIDVRADEVYTPKPSNGKSNGNGFVLPVNSEIVCSPQTEYKPSPERLLQDAIVNRHSCEFSADAMARVNYFVNEDATQYNADMGKLADSFGKFKLGKRLRGVEDVRVRNFFDDVMLEYLIPGNTPSSKDLERIYESNI